MESGRDEASKISIWGLKAMLIKVLDFIVRVKRNYEKGSEGAEMYFR